MALDIDPTGFQLFHSSFIRLALDLNPARARMPLLGIKKPVVRLFAKSPCVKGRANEWRVQGVMRAWMNIHNRRITQELPLIRRDWS
jgi:hypothetical protein